MVFCYDRRDGRVKSLEIPEKPLASSLSLSTAEVPDSTVLALTGTLHADVGATADWTVLDYATTGGFRLADWEVDANFGGTPMGTSPVLHIDTDGGSTADYLYYTFGSPQDLSDVTQLTFSIRSTGEDFEGTPLYFCMGETDYDDFTYPVTIEKADVVQHITIDLTSYATSTRNAITKMGFKRATSEQFVVWIGSITSGGGLTGTVRYKVRDVTEQGWSSLGNELTLTGPESPGPDDDDLKEELGSAGVKVTLTRAYVPDDACSWEIYRMQDGVDAVYRKVAPWPQYDRWQPNTAYTAGDIVRPSTFDQARCDSSGTPTAAAPYGTHQFYYTCLIGGTSADRDSEPTWPTDPLAATVGDGAGGVAPVWGLTVADRQNLCAYTDDTVDIATNDALTEGRVPVPSPATAIGLYDNHLALAVDTPNRTEIASHTGNVWLSGQDRSEWAAWGPEDWPTLEAAGKINLASACRMPLGEIGRVMAMAPLGVWTGAAYTGPLMIASQGGWTVALQGHGPTLSEGGYSLGFRLPLGCCGPEAACRDQFGNVYLITPAGDLMRLDAQMRPEYLSRGLEDVLRNADDDWRAWWANGFDAPSRRVVLATESRTFALDTDTGTWDEMSSSVWGRPYVFGEKPGPGGYLVMVKWEAS